jgi:hypothetical protein
MVVDRDNHRLKQTLPKVSFLCYSSVKAGAIESGSRMYVCT